MTKALYGLGREGFLGSDIDWDADTIKPILIDTGLYAVDIDVDQFLSDIPVGARVAIGPALTSKTKALGVAGAANAVFSAVSGNSAEAWGLFQDTGVEATSRLIMFDDEASGLPVAPNSGDINLNFDAGVNKIFKL